MTGKKCMMVTEWVLMPAAALKGALALKYRERTNHQSLFHFVLSRRKTYLKNCKAWIRYLKKKLAKGNTQQTSLVVCPRSLTPCCSSSTIDGGCWEAQRRCWGDPGCAFYKPDKRWSMAEYWWREKKQQDELHGKKMVFLLPTFAHPSLGDVPHLWVGTNSSSCLYRASGKNSSVQSLPSRQD